MSTHNQFHTYIKPAQTIVSREINGSIRYNHRVKYAFMPSGGMPPVVQSHGA